MDKMLEKVQTKTAKREPLAYWLADWFRKQGDKIVSHQEIAQAIYEARRQAKMPARDIKMADVASIISAVRARLESTYQVTIWNIHGIGYKIASSRECAMFTMKTVLRTVKMADRCYSLADIVDRREIPGAFQTVFIEAENGVKSLSKRGKKFAALWNQVGKENSGEAKAITHKK